MKDVERRPRYALRAAAAGTAGVVVTLALMSAVGYLAAVGVLAVVFVSGIAIGGVSVAAWLTYGRRS